MLDLLKTYRESFAKLKDSMNNLEIEYRKTSELLPYARNARKHSDPQVRQIAASIKEFGFNAPILIDDKNMILAGHGRCLAAEILEMDKVPTIRLNHLSEIQGKAYNLTDNQLALNADWDMDLLKLEVQELKELDFGLEVIGFENLDELLEIAPEFEFTGKEKDESDDEKFELKVIFKSREEKEQLFLELRDRGIEVKS